MSESIRDASIMGMVEGYRIKVHCFKCGAEYITRLLERNRARKCKRCGSTQINYIDTYPINRSL